MEKNTRFNIILDEDLHGLSIGIIEEFIIDGETVSKPIKRRAFRQYGYDEAGEYTLNTAFEQEVDAWTGEENFIQNKLNF